MILSVIAVSEAHSKWFHRYRSYFMRSNRAFELGAGPNDIFVLYDKRVREATVNLKNKVETIELFNVAGMIEGHQSECAFFGALRPYWGNVTYRW